jgi:hypothetical protein
MAVWVGVIDELPDAGLAWSLFNNLVKTRG